MENEEKVSVSYLFFTSKQAGGDGPVALLKLLARFMKSEKADE